MSEIPSAIIENARPPFYKRAGVRRLVAVAVIAGACFAGWKLIKPWLRSDTSKQLAERQDKARASVGDGLDDLFDHLLDHGSSSVQLVARLEVAPGLGGGYSEYDCGYGLDDAFKDALGPEVVTFSTLDLHPDPDTRIEITAKITPNGRGFQLPNSDKVYPGISMSADIRFLGKDIHADVQPPADIEFKRVQVGISFEGPSAADVAGGILQGTCKQAGYAVLEALTTWKHPGPPPRPDPVKECEQGFHCRDNAEMLEGTDKAAAAKLYAKACENDDDTACTRAADLGIELAKPGIDDPSTHVRGTLEMACFREVAGACSGSARMALLSLEPGKPASAYARGKALLDYMRACDLGDRDACTAAAPLVTGTRYAEAAPLLSGATSAVSKTFGTIFAFRWGQWTDMDSGQPTMWLTKEPAKLPDGAIVSTFTGDKVPKGLVVPAGVTTVYAVALDRGHGGDYDRRCNVCMPSGGGDSVFSMRSTHCICALAPKKR